MFNRYMTRRNFLKKSIHSTAFITAGSFLFGSLITSCAQILFKEEGPINYPKLPGKKVQPSEQGCYIGIHHQDNADYFKYADFGWIKAQLGKGPAILVPPYSRMEATGTADWLRWFHKVNLPEDFIGDSRAIPHIYRIINARDLIGIKLKDLAGDKVFGRNIEEYAKNITKLGRPMFFTTFHELNHPIHVWGMKAKEALPVYKFIWQIFEDTGANEYATWVWEIYAQVDEYHADAPSRYYPGDKYVDWVGLSAFSRDSDRTTGNLSFESLIYNTYKSMRTNHPDKPIMISEFGKTKSPRQSRWIKKAFESIKESPGIKGATYWDNILKYKGYLDDHMLSPESWATMGEIIKDPYWIYAPERI